VERSRAFGMKTLRLLPAEDRILDSACAALQGLDRATLIMEAALFEANRLGIRHSAEDPPKFKGTWPFAPDRGDEPTGVRLTITLSLSTLELVGRAAKHVGTSEPLFLIGSTLAYIGRLQKQFRGTHADSPDLAVEIRKTLEAIRLPPRYHYRARRTR
jgi:uncharacterized protein (DUF1778 family)